ncbi:MAG: ThuA domain-containing protein [Verrucomicrobiaceae bacterium]|nr:ThuA domain-containing protein [Verrucomicrobiaceae bacterium]
MKLLPLIALALAATSTFAADAKRVLVCTVTAGFRHSSIPWAEKTLQKLADESNGAFTIVGFVQQPDIQVPQAPRKPKDLDAAADDNAKKRYANDMKRYEAEMAKWTPEVQADAKAKQQALADGQKKALERLSPANLAAEKIDGVIFANTTGPLPLPDKDGFIKWIEEGHAFMGMHSSSDTLHPRDVGGWGGYIDMLQGEFETHKAQVPADLIAGDTEHPANAGIGPNWNLAQEEMYIIKSQDRSKVRSLWFMRHHPNDAADQRHFPVSWCRKAGNGKVFYTSLGHREDLWSDSPEIKDRKNSVELSKQYQAHITGGIKWALGLADGSSTPNPEVK